MTFYARTDESGYKQTLKNHIEGVRKRTSASNLYNFEHTVELASIFHDAGKYSAIWQEYLLNPGNKRVPHSTFGMALFSTLTNKNFSAMRKDDAFIYLIDMVTFAIGAHHGIYDNLTMSGDWQSFNKINKVLNDNEYFEATTKNFLSEYDEAYITNLIKKAMDEMKAFISSLPKDKIIRNFYCGMLARIILSTVIDGDWSDAAAFFDSTESEWKSIYDTFSFESLLDNLHIALKGFTEKTKINTIREKISNECYESATRQTGIFKLNVPTGGAKTLAAMRFALRHAICNNKKRIIYIAPYKSILSQNAEEYKTKLTKADKNRDLFILEHHGDVVLDEETDDKAQIEFNHKRKYLTENWDAPIILTTMVQFLNTLFSSKSQSIRRFNKLAESVIIIDEFQALQNNSFSIFNLTMNFLNKYFGTTFVLTTATQPPFESEIGLGRYNFKAIEYAKNPDLVSDYSNEKAFLRTKIIDKSLGKEIDEVELSDIISKRMENIDSLLVIVNTRDACKKVFQEVKKRNRDFEVKMLSNNMIPKHRDEVLKKVIESIETKRIVLISTQLIEAGVDISFDGVIRSLAGLDSIAQAAGRCNRHGKKDIGEVWIIKLKSNVENTDPIEDIKIAKETMSAILEDFNRYPKRYDCDLLSQKALKFYFENYFEQIDKHIKSKLNKSKEVSIMDLLSINSKGSQEFEDKFKIKPIMSLRQAFKTAGNKYKPIDNNQVPVLVEYDDDGKNLVLELNSEKGIYETKRILRKAARYILQISKGTFENLKSEGEIFMANEVPILRESSYSNDMGLNSNQVEEISTITF
ncbi:MAG: CRISPR-associated helicase Cas3' [Tissierellia bacterium]|nr:CRISPR-associated helicase Cas3' [Tissierellia bacterium]